MDIFRSEAFYKAVIGVVVMVLTALVPELKPSLDILVPAILGVIGLWIGAPAIESFALNQRAQAAAHTAQAEAVRSGRG